MAKKKKKTSKAISSPIVFNVPPQNSKGNTDYGQQETPTQVTPPYEYGRPTLESPYTRLPVYYGTSWNRDGTYAGIDRTLVQTIEMDCLLKNMTLSVAVRGSSTAVWNERLMARLFIRDASGGAIKALIGVVLEIEPDEATGSAAYRSAHQSITVYGGDIPLQAGDLLYIEYDCDYANFFCTYWGNVFLQPYR